MAVVFNPFTGNLDFTGGGGGGDTIYAGLAWQATKVLTNDEILTLPTEPVEIVPAPGANRALLVPIVAGAAHLSLILDQIADYSNVSGTGHLRMHVGSTNSGALVKLGFANSFGFFFAWGGPDTIAWWPSSGTDADFGDIYDATQSINSLSDFTDKPLFISVDNSGAGPFGDGDPANVLTVSVLYYVIDTLTGEFIPSNAGADGGVQSLNGLSGSLSLVAGNNVTFSTAGKTITVNAAGSGGPGRLSYTQNFPIQQAGVVMVGNILSTGTTAASATDNPFGSSLSLQRLYVPSEMHLTEVDLAYGIAFPATNQGQGSLSQSFVVYSFGNSTSLASVLSASRSASWASGTTTAGTSSSLQQGWSGPNVQPFTFASSSLPAGEYAFAHLFSWAAESTSWALSVYGANAQATGTASVVTNLVSASLAAASSFTTASSAMTAWSASPTAANVLSSAGFAAVSALTATTGAALTAFTGAPATLPVFLTVTGTSVALSAASAFSASTSAGITAFSAAPTSAPVFATANGVNAALLAVSAHSGSTGTAITVFTIAPTAANALSSTGLVAASGITGALGVASYAAAFLALSTAGSQTGFTMSAPASAAASSQNTAVSVSVTNAAKSASFQLIGNAANSNIVSAVTLGGLAGSIHSASGSFVALSNAGTNAVGVLSSGGFIGGSFLTASSIAGVLSNSGTGASAFLSSGGLLAGSVMTASGVANAYTGGTGAFTALSAAGLSAGSFHSASTSTAVLANAGTSAVSLARPFATASFGALTAAAIATGSVGAVSSTIPNFGYNGSSAMTTNATQTGYRAGKFSAGILSTGSWRASINLNLAELTLTGSVALKQPWFALAGL